MTTAGVPGPLTCFQAADEFDPVPRSWELGIVHRPGRPESYLLIPISLRKRTLLQVSAYSNDAGAMKSGRLGSDRKSA